MPLKSNLNPFIVLLFFTVFSVNSQVFKTANGSLEALSGVQRYQVKFEYAQDLEIPKYESEATFLEIHSQKKEKKEAGSGEAFKNEWFSRRSEQYEPKFIQEFNFFNLKEKQVTVARNISDSEYKMVIYTSLIDPGNSNFFFKKDARLEVVIRIYNANNSDTVIYETQVVDVHSKGASLEDYDRIMSAYAELGRGLSKHLSRKTLN